MKMNKILVLAIIALGTGSLIEANKFNNLKAFQNEANRVGGMRNQTQRSAAAIDAIDRYLEGPMQGGQTAANQLVGYIIERKPKARLQGFVKGANIALLAGGAKTKKGQDFKIKFTQAKKNLKQANTQIDNANKTIEDLRKTIKELTETGGQSSDEQIQMLDDRNDELQKELDDKENDSRLYQNALRKISEQIKEIKDRCAEYRKVMATRKTAKKDSYKYLPADVQYAGDEQWITDSASNIKSPLAKIMQDGFDKFDQ